MSQRARRARGAHRQLPLIGGVVMGDALDFIARRHFGILEIGLAQLAIGKIPQAVGDAPQRVIERSGWLFSFAKLELWLTRRT